MSTPRLCGRLLLLALLGAPPAQAAVDRLQPSAPSSLAPMWRRPLVREGMARRVIDSQSTPVIDSRRQQVICGTGEGDIVAVDARNVALRWRFAYTAPIEAPMALVPSEGRSLAVVGAKDGALLALDATDGSLVWRVPLDAEVRARPVFQDGRLYVTTSANQLLALDAKSGRVLWSSGRQPSAGMSVQGHAEALRLGARVFTSYSDGFAVAVDAASGAPLWSRPLSLSGGRFVDADAGPVTAAGYVLFASVTDGIYALDVEDGSTVWQQSLKDVTSLAVLPPSVGRSVQTVVAADVDGFVYAFAADTGTNLWRTSLGDTPVLAVHPWQGQVVALSGSEGLWLLSAERGQPVSVQPLGGMAGGDVAVSDDGLAHVGRNGALMFWQRPAAPLK